MPKVLWIIVRFGALTTLALSCVFATKFPKVQAAMTTLVATVLALNIWLLSAYSRPFSGELKIKPTMFVLLKESVLTAPDGPSRFLYDPIPEKKRPGFLAHRDQSPGLPYFVARRFGSLWSCYQELV